MPFAATWIELEGIMYAEQNKSDREQQTLCDLTYTKMGSKKKTSNKTALIDPENRLVGARNGGGQVK